MREAIAAFATRAAEKLRGERLEVRQLTVFAHTNPHNGDSWYSGTRSAQIEPTSDSLALVGEATRLLAALWRPGFRYFKAGVMLNDLFPARQQAGMFATRDVEKSARAMAALDSVNARFGRGALRMGRTAGTALAALYHQRGGDIGGGGVLTLRLVLRDGGCRHVVVPLSCSGGANKSILRASTDGDLNDDLKDSPREEANDASRSRVPGQTVS